MNSTWKKSWLATTEAESPASDRRPDQAMQIGNDSASGTTMPSRPGISPPPARCDIRATNVADAAARPPRNARAPLVRSSRAGIRSPSVSRSARFRQLRTTPWPGKVSNAA
jgi:hypothetical protein